MCEILKLRMKPGKREGVILTLKMAPKIWACDSEIENGTPKMLSMILKLRTVSGKCR